MPTASHGTLCLPESGRGSKHLVMVGIVVVGHGRLAEEMVRILEGVLGPLDGLESVTTAYSDPPDAIRERIASAVRRVDRGAGAIILTDMLGDTPTNLSLAVARETGAEVTVAKDGQVVNGRSIMGVMMLAAEQGSRIEVTTSGPEAAEALAAIRALVDARFQEPE